MRYRFLEAASKMSIGKMIGWQTVGEVAGENLKKLESAFADRKVDLGL